MEDQAYSHYFFKFLSQLENRLAEKVLSQLLENSPSFAMTIESKERLLTGDQLCEALQISTSHFYATKKRNKHFPVYDINGAIRYKQSEVEQFFKQLQILKEKK